MKKDFTLKSIQFNFSLGNRVLRNEICLRPEFNDRDEWVVSIKISYRRKTFSFPLPSSIETLRRYIEEMNDEDEWTGYKGIGLAGHTEEQCVEFIELIKQKAEQVKPSFTRFQYNHQDLPVFPVGKGEVAVNCEWFENNGERWSFSAHLITWDNDTFIGGDESTDSLKNAINYLSQYEKNSSKLDSPTTDQLNNIINFIRSAYQKHPTISAHEYYFGY